MFERVASFSTRVQHSTICSNKVGFVRRFVRYGPIPSYTHISQFYFSPAKHLKSSANPSPIFVFLVASSLVVGGSVYTTGKESESETPKAATGELDQAVLDDCGKMAGTTLLGRPGNLTTDQEAKLRELWTATLKVFGVQAEGKPEDAKDSLSVPPAGTPDPTTKKKKSGLFRRNKDDDDEGAQTNQEDKYGQSKEFQQVLATENPENLRRAFWSMAKHDHPDGLLLRFLRARKWDVHNAVVMLIATMNWRMKEMHVDDDIMKKGEAQAVVDNTSSNAAIKKEGLDFLAQLRLGKSFMHGMDKAGRPMCFVRVRLHKQGEQSETSLERYTVYTIETARLLLSPPVDTAAIVFDMTGFSMANMDYSPVKFMIKCFEANYPESLGVVLVHKSPWIFHSIWKIIKGWLDPVVASKVHFTQNLEELEQFIEKSRIIKELGGDDPFEYRYVEPRDGENEKMSDEGTRQRLLEERAIVVKEYEAMTHEWIANPQDRTSLQQKRNDLAERLRSGYWQLDPYVRARSIYDRLGLIGESGIIRYYDKAAAPKADPKLGINSTEHGTDDVD